MTINSRHDFDYIKINLASPKRIKEWGQRILPNGQIVGEVTKPELAKPTPGGKAAPMDSQLGKDLNTLLKDPKANIDQTLKRSNSGSR